jgi:hypothetical protein
MIKSGLTFDLTEQGVSVGSTYMAGIQQAIDDTKLILKDRPLGEANPDGVQASPLNRFTNNATVSGGHPVTVIVNNPTVTNPVTVDSLAYMIGKRASVAFAGAA